VLHTFQACAFDRSATSPLGPQGYRTPPQLSNRRGAESRRGAGAYPGVAALFGGAGL
jgi:hypothetical protein